MCVYSAERESARAMNVFQGCESCTYVYFNARHSGDDDECQSSRLLLLSIRVSWLKRKQNIIEKATVQ